MGTAMFTGPTSAVDSMAIAARDDDHHIAQSRRSGISVWVPTRVMRWLPPAVQSGASALTVTQHRPAAGSRHADTREQSSPSATPWDEVPVERADQPGVLLREHVERAVGQDQRLPLLPWFVTLGGEHSGHCATMPAPPYSWGPRAHQEGPVNLDANQVKRAGKTFMRTLVGFALVDYATAIAIGAVYAPPKGPIDFLYDVLLQVVAGSIGVLPLAVVSSGLWLLLKDRIPSPTWLGAAVGVGSGAFILTWTNFVLGSPPAPQPSQVLGAGLGIASGAYAAWMALRAKATAKSVK